MDLSGGWSSSPTLSHPLTKVNSSDWDETCHAQMFKQSDGVSITQLVWMFLPWTQMEAVLKLRPQGGFQTKRWRREMVALVEAGRRYRTVPRRHGEWDSPSVHEEVTDASVTNFRHKDLFVLQPGKRYQTWSTGSLHLATATLVLPYHHTFISALSSHTKIHQHKLKPFLQLPLIKKKKKNTKSLKTNVK